MTSPEPRGAGPGRPGRAGRAGRQVRVAVDRDACEANGVCAGLVPEVFDLGDSDELAILADPVPGELADAVAHAVRSCPKAALRLLD